MKKIKFEDLEFKSHPNGIGTRAVIDFENGYGVSVVFGDMYYSDGMDTYELAVTKGGHLDYDNPVADGDVRGYLEKDELVKLINKVARFKKAL